MSSSRIGDGFPVRGWSGGETGRPPASLEQGPVRISGAVLDGGACWHVTTDRLGWTTVALVGDPRGRVSRSRVDRALRVAAAETAGPVETALEVSEALGPMAAHTGLAVARISPHGRIVELLNVSLPTVIQWDPIEGISPFEPIYDCLAQLRSDATTEVLHLSEGSVIALATCGVLSRDASWQELRSFVSAVALDPLGGTLAEAPPAELERLLESSWPIRTTPSALVVLGIPSAIRQVA
jgi:hypothetical protein